MGNTAWIHLKLGSDQAGTNFGNYAGVRVSYCSNKPLWMIVNCEEECSRDGTTMKATGGDCSEWRTVNTKIDWFSTFEKQRDVRAIGFQLKIEAPATTIGKFKFCIDDVSFY